MKDLHVSQSASLKAFIIASLISVLVILHSFSDFCADRTVWFTQHSKSNQVVWNLGFMIFWESKKLNAHLTGIRGKIPWSDFSLGRNSKDSGFDPWNKIIRLNFHSNDSQIVIFSEPRIPNDSKSK